MVKASERLEAAADYIERNGLHKGTYFKGVPEDDDLYFGQRAEEFVQKGEEPKCCTLGALAMVTAQSGGYPDVADWEEPARYLARVTGDDAAFPVHAIPEWNDKPSQRKDRVASALRKAAQIAREEGK